MSINLYSENLVNGKIVFDPQEINSNTYLFAIKLNISNDWHIYWKNPGDAGIPTQIKFTSNNSSTKFSEIFFPAPELFYADGIFSFGYKDEIFLPFLVETENISSLNFNVQIYGLACNNICEEFNLNLTFDYTKNSNNVEHNLIKYFYSLPIQNNDLTVEIQETLDSVKLIFNNIIHNNIQSAYFFPEKQNLFVYEKQYKYLISRNSIIMEFRKNPLNSSEQITPKGILKLITKDQTFHYNINE